MIVTSRHCDALVVDVDGDAAVAVGAALGVVDQADLLRRDHVAHVVAGDRTAEHQVGFAGVADRFVGEDAGEARVHDHVVLARLGVDARGLVAQLLVEVVEVGVETRSRR